MEKTREQMQKEQEENIRKMMEEGGDCMLEVAVGATLSGAKPLKEKE